MTRFKPGDKVAYRIDTAVGKRSGQLALGRVQKDGKVLFQEIVDHNGTHTNRFGHGVRPGKAVPIPPNTQHCPKEFAHHIK